MKLYDFKEKSLSKNFAKEKVNEFKKLIAHSPSFCIQAIPGVGVTNFLRYFSSTQEGYYFIFVETFGLASFTKKDFFAQILKEIGVKNIPENEQQILEKCRVELEKIAKSDRVVIILNRFNQLKSLFDFQFFANLRWLQITNRDKITIICTTNRPLYELCPEAIGGSNLNLFSTIYDFGLYKDEDLKKLYPSSTDQNIKLASGHIQLLQLLNKAEPGEAAFHDPFISLQLKSILDGVSSHTRKSLIKKPFTPLLGHYIKYQKSHKLPKREVKLFNLLKQYLGKVVPKERIFEVVWGEGSAEATDWALNSLIYRLRKNPQIARDYSIESHKKSGYALSKN